MKIRPTYEMQGPENVPEGTEDEVFVRDANGEFVKLEVSDDAEDD